MKHELIHTFGFVAAALLALGAMPANAQATANGPYYANSSWDQTLPTSTRFIVLSNMNSQAVLDRETGLVWQRSPLPPTSWTSASSVCAVTGTGGRMGWRLPTVNEITSLFDPSAFGASGTNPPLPAGHPF